MPDRVFVKTVGGKPRSGALVQSLDPVRLFSRKTSTQHICEQVVVAIPGTFDVEGDQEEVAALQFLQHLRAVDSSRHRVTQ